MSFAGRTGVVLVMAAVVVPGATARADEWDDLVGVDGLAKIAAACPSKAPARPQAPRKVLVLTEAKSDLDRAAKSSGMKFVPHPSAPHCAKAVEALGKKTGAFEATITSDFRTVTSERLKGYDAVVLANVYLEGKLYSVPREEGDQEKFRPAQDALLAFVKGGKGLVGIHNAACEALGWGAYNAMLGGTHRGHAWWAHQTVPIRIDDARSPLTAAFGGKGLEVRDDIYLMGEPYSRTQCHVLLSVEAAKAPESMTAERADGDYPVSWIKTHGEGRVFYTALGDNAATFADPAFLQHLLAGIQFATGDLPTDTAGGAPRQTTAGFTPMKGWTPLFDGKSLGAWQVSDQQATSWLVEDGILRYDGRSGSLRTKESFGDYQLRVDFRLPRKADSGVFVRDSKQLNIWTWAMGSGEMWEHRGRAKTDEERKQYIPKTREDRPVGEWNTFLITVQDNRVTVVLNGKEVITKAKLLGVRDSSPIGLQRHGDPLEYKSIYIRKLGG